MVVISYKTHDGPEGTILLLRNGRRTMNFQTGFFSLLRMKGDIMDSFFFIPNATAIKKRVYPLLTRV
jgi:hypothetical protein